MNRSTLMLAFLTLACAACSDPLRGTWEGKECSASGPVTMSYSFDGSGDQWDLEVNRDGSMPDLGFGGRYEWDDEKDSVVLHRCDNQLGQPCNDVIVQEWSKVTVAEDGKSLTFEPTSGDFHSCTGGAVSLALKE